MKGTVLERLRRSDAAEPFNWVTRAKIQSLMNEHYHRCKTAVDQHLDAYYGDHQGSVFQRGGVTASVSVELFEAQAVKLVGLLADCLKPFSGDAKAFQMIADMSYGFLSYIDLVVGRIGPRIDLEMRNLPKPEEAPAGAGKLWSESRARILEALDRHRSEFGLPAKPAAAAPAEAPASLDTECPPPASETEAGTELELCPEQEAKQEAEQAADRQESQPMPFAQHWHDMWTEIAVQLCTGKLRPGGESDLGRAMANWFADQGIDGAGGEVDACARRLWLKLAPPQGVTSSLGQGTIDLAVETHDSRLDRLAWRSGSLSSAGFAAGGTAHFANPEFRCAAPSGPTSPEPAFEPARAPAPERAPRGFARREAVEEAPAPEGMRYHVSWTMGEERDMPAPGFDIV